MDEEKSTLVPLVRKPRITPWLVFAILYATLPAQANGVSIAIIYGKKAFQKCKPKLALLNQRAQHHNSSDMDAGVENITDEDPF